MRNFFIRVSAAALAISGLTQVAHAASVDQFESLYKRNPGMAELYLLGVGEGLSWSNVMLLQRGDAALYCPPTDKTFGGEEYTEIARRQVSEMRAGGQLPNNMPIDLALYMGMTKTYPCK